MKTAPQRSSALLTIPQVASPEDPDDREALQAGRVPDPAAVQPRRGRDRGLDQREAADGHRRVLQGPHQHPGTHTLSA